MRWVFIYHGCLTGDDTWERKGCFYTNEHGTRVPEGKSAWRKCNMLLVHRGIRVEALNPAILAHLLILTTCLHPPPPNPGPMLTLWGIIRGQAPGIGPTSGTDPGHAPNDPRRLLRSEESSHTSISSLPFPPHRVSLITQLARPQSSPASLLPTFKWYQVHKHRRPNTSCMVRCVDPLLPTLLLGDVAN